MVKEVKKVCILNLRDLKGILNTQRGPTVKKITKIVQFLNKETFMQGKAYFFAQFTIFI